MLDFIKYHIKPIAAVGIAAIVGIVAAIAISTINGAKLEATVEYGEGQKATITVGEPGGRGSYQEEVTEIEGEEIPTVEEVDANGPQTEVNAPECPEGKDCGRGAAFDVDISSPTAFRLSTFGRCIDTDGYYGAQCWDLTNAFWWAYVNRSLDTCGTGAAKGTIANGCWQKNAGGEFTMIWDPTQLQAGDIVVFNNGQWGHIGMAMGTYNNGYVTLLGQNQGGGYCNGGGSATNIVNISLKSFAGAFRPNIYIPPTPTPAPEPTPEQTTQESTQETAQISACVRREVQFGDTMAKYMRECRGEVEWGLPMNEYASHWYSTKLQRYLTVYDGWASIGGYGLFAGDIIEYRG